MPAALREAAGGGWRLAPERAASSEFEQAASPFLERIGNVEAKHVLRHLAEGESTAWLTIEALHGRSIPIASAEDVILTKLEWDKITPSQRQLKDALDVAVVQWPKLDRAYFRRRR